MEYRETLLQLGFSGNEADVYLAVLSGGPDSVRAIAAKAGLNRATAYDALRNLAGQGAVGYYNREKKQYFVAEPPEKLLNILRAKIESLENVRSAVEVSVPALRSLYDAGGDKPTTKLYEGASGVRTVLEDVLETCGALDPRAYVAYSAAGLRETLYGSHPGFTRERIRRRIAVRVIALGGGGADAEFAERRWLTREDGAPSYTLVYGPKVAAITLAKGNAPQAVLIDDAALAETQRIIFEHLWTSLAK